MKEVKNLENYLQAAKKIKAQKQLLKKFEADLNECEKLFLYIRLKKEGLYEKTN